jgi:hypothetical protein
VPNHLSSAAQNKLPVLVLLLLVILPFAIQPCSAQPTNTVEDKALSFIRDVIHIDVDQYEITQTPNLYDVNKATLTITLEPKTPTASGGNYALYVEFNSGYLTYFSVTPDAGPLIYKQPRQDRFNETLGIIDRYQTWLNDPQVGEMAILMRQIGSEQSTFHSSGNLSLNIRLYSDVGEYRFSNYFSGLEYSGVCISQSQGGSILFTDNRGSQKIGNTAIGISEDQAVAIGKEYFNSKPPNGTLAHKTATNVNITGVKFVTLKSGPRINFTLYPYYDIEFKVGTQSNINGCWVSVDANAGEILNSRISYDLTNTSPVSSNSDSDSHSNILLIVVVSVLVSAAVIIGVYESRLRFNVDPDTV